MTSNAHNLKAACDKHHKKLGQRLTNFSLKLKSATHFYKFLLKHSHDHLCIYSFCKVT